MHGNKVSGALKTLSFHGKRRFHQEKSLLLDAKRNQKIAEAIPKILFIFGDPKNAKHFFGFRILKIPFSQYL